MNVHVDSFYELVKQEWNFPNIGKGTSKTEFHLRGANYDISGGKITKKEIDILQDYPDIKSITVSGLTQETFEYFINQYGKQFKYIEFFKNKTISDWSLLTTLEEIECLEFFVNQRIDHMWDLSNNRSLKALVINDFTRLHDLTGIEKAPALRWFDFGNKVWCKASITSLKMLANTSIQYLQFGGKVIDDADLSFVLDMPELEVFNFPLRHFSTEQVAWLKANCPNLEGCSIKPYKECYSYIDPKKVESVFIVGKRKPTIKIEDQRRIQKYVDQFNLYVKELKGKLYPL